MRPTLNHEKSQKTKNCVTNFFNQIFLEKICVVLIVFMGLSMFAKCFTFAERRRGASVKKIIKKVGQYQKKPQRETV